MTLALAALIGLAFYVVNVLDTERKISPDGRFYILAGSGEPVPTPYRFRWLPPALCGKSAVRWRLLTATSLVAWGPLMAWYLAGLGFAPWQQLAGAALLCGLPAMFRLGVALPILVDPPAFALALASAGAWVHGATWAALGLAVAAGACKETAPVFAALWAWHPALLAGLVGAAWLARRGAIPDWTKEWISHPLTAALKAHRGAWLDWRQMLLPWGALAVLAPLGVGFDRMSLTAGACLAVAYGSLLLAQDRARLFGWAAPAVIPLALAVIPNAWAVPILLAHSFNPYRGV